jgi:glycerol-3-phosphate acyltransferase
MYPEPLIFHDGRLAFTPTPIATLAMFLYLPLGLALSVLRSIIFSLLPYRLSIPLGSLTGSKSRLVAQHRQYDIGKKSAGGQLFVCNHRTLLDPIAISAGLNRPVTAVTYSLSRLSEILSPIQTARLTRDKEEDRRRMSTLLARSDLVVCPEGTTCREPYLLRFSPLFAELIDEVIPVALSTHVDMFYGTSTSIFKFMDPFYYLMNPRPEYRVEFLEKIPTEGQKSIDVANRVQREIGEALGFELTALTRRDKYIMLAGNEGIVKD